MTANEFGAVLTGLLVLGMLFLLGLLGHHPIVVGFTVASAICAFLGYQVGAAAEGFDIPENVQNAGWLAIVCSWVCVAIAIVFLLT